MTMQNLEQRLLLLNSEQLKDIYLHLLGVLEPELGLILTSDEEENKENEDLSLLEEFFSQMDISKEDIIEYKNPSIDFLLKIAETFPEYRNEIEISLDNICNENISLDIPTSATVLKPIIFAVAVALIRPYLKIDVKKETKNKNYTKTSEFIFDFKAPGAQNIVDVVKKLCDYFKKP